jgi:UDP-glucose 4-epimerase
MAQPLDGKHILVTGIGGFIGAELARKLLSLGAQVTGIDDFSSGHETNVPEAARLVRGDLAQADSYQKLDGHYDYICHLAGQSSGEISFDNPVADLEKNTIATLNLIRFGIEKQVGKLIYASSMSVYGQQPDAPTPETAIATPSSCYGVGKLAAEQYLRIFAPQLPFIGFRMFNVYGPGQDMQNMRQGMVSIFLAQALNGTEIEVKGALDRYRDFIFIDDVVDIWVQALGNEAANNDFYNLGAGQRTTVGDLLDAIQKATGARNIRVSGGTPGDQFGIYPCLEKLSAAFNLNAPIDIETGIKRFVEAL